MPGLNQIGPMGQGSMTGRRMGKCTNFGAKNRQTTDNGTQENSQMNGMGYGFGCGKGGGQRMRRRNQRGRENNN